MHSLAFAFSYTHASVNYIDKFRGLSKAGLDSLIMPPLEWQEAQACQSTLPCVLGWVDLPDKEDDDDLFFSKAREGIEF